MAKLIHFTRSGPGTYREFVYIAESEDDDKAVKEYEMMGWVISGLIKLDDDELGSFPTGRELTP